MMENELLKQSSMLEITDNARYYLKSIAGWTKFFAILYFVMIGLMVLAGIGLIVANNVMMPYYNHVSSMFVGLMYVIISGVMVFPAIYLYNFGNRIVSALMSDKSLILEDAFNQMRLYWKFTGIFAIVIFACAILMFPLFMFVGALVMI